MPGDIVKDNKYFKSFILLGFKFLSFYRDFIFE